jgi:hypothetical protein
VRLRLLGRALAESDCSRQALSVLLFFVPQIHLPPYLQVQTESHEKSLKWPPPLFPYSPHIPGLFNSSVQVKLLIETLIHIGINQDLLAL